MTPERKGILVRLPEDLLLALRDEAERQKVPLNQLIVAILAGAVGYRT